VVIRLYVLGREPIEKNFALEIVVTVAEKYICGMLHVY
jgi:hypothetical protein